MTDRKTNGGPHGAGNGTGNGPGKGTEADGGSDEDADEVTTEAGMPPPVVDLVTACMRFVATRYGLPLDFSGDTLSLIDQYVRDARTELKERPEGLDLMQGAVGAYLGEVIRLTHGGTWRAEGDPSAWRVQLSRVYLAFNPIGMAREALTLEEAEGWGAHLQLDDAEKDAVESRLAALPEVDEAEFSLPSTRFDVVQIAVAALRARMEASGLGDVRFGPEDYD
jgi:hypothetical protein